MSYGKLSLRGYFGLQRLRLKITFAAVVVVVMFAGADGRAVRAAASGSGPDRSSIAAALLAGPKLTTRESRNWRDAFTATERGRWRRARRAAGKGRDKLLAKIHRWFHLIQPNARIPFAEIAAFVEANPNWPDQDKLARRAEESMTAALPRRAVLDWFAQHPPLTTDGGIILGTALIDSGRRAEGYAVIRNTWVEGGFGRKQTRAFLKRYRKLLRGEDHRDRLDRLLWDRSYREARRMLSKVPAGDRALAQARMRLHLFRGGVDWAIRRVPKNLRNDPGLLYERMRWRRRKKRLEEAVEILVKPPRDLVRPEKWWRERSALARPLLADGRAKLAYRIVSDHRLSTGREFAEAEWLSGWIALRFTKQPKVAFKHFERMYGTVRYPISRARAAYWSGRASASAGDKATAAGWYARAAEFDTTYYGQLAAERMVDAVESMPPIEPKPNAESLARFGQNELARAVVLLDALGRDKLVRRFIHRLARQSNEAVHKLLVGRLALAIGRKDLGVRVARHAYRKGIQLPSLAYPMVQMPSGKPERGLLLAVARQESNMDPSAKSSAGALGLMQLMPRTAREVSRSLRIRYSRARLTQDPAYNIRLGRAYLGRLLNRFDNSYILSIAAYNAGPNAVRRWVRKNGNPSRVDFDAIDWIEMIPYGETRNYVQRIMENLQVYRRRLGVATLAQSLEDDLAR